MVLGIGNSSSRSSSTDDDQAGQSQTGSVVNVSTGDASGKNSDAASTINVLDGGAFERAVNFAQDNSVLLNQNLLLSHENNSELAREAVAASAGTVNQLVKLTEQAQNNSSRTTESVNASIAALNDKTDSGNLVTLTKQLTSLPVLGAVSVLAVAVALISRGKRG